MAKSFEHPILELLLATAAPLLLDALWGILLSGGEADRMIDSMRGSSSHGKASQQGMATEYGRNIVQYGNAGYWLHICYFTGLSNMILQGGFKAAATLEATINGDLAFLGNAIFWREPLFWTVAMLPLAASFVFLMIPPIPRSTPPPDVCVWKSMKFIVAEKLFRRLAPSVIVNGMIYL
ncbi:hypothetical protein Pmar_PMAR004373 [Perkinsus marinus ATCC 50983]|uniref:Uncharacterized protein n=1 Tax=Perkinsus marinus (strain ATCC 50983 / TXsc) TaxID=423536 RepID=C5KAH5_PERM5|nr:hypothetical protein Pmar_PMAR004373 [Perkinsus marinus ATCC 50983]EER18511.1 hypothetical protein Pmar_PMAR004373 [Perkinsus marinus ATCC 50983]|eukprot:XP_002786715.1 hypothetical protein Pmar_PMAR004373 [Perkinsus marinus ATCC 50983]